MELADTTDESLKKIKGNIAELTRPARQIRSKLKEKTWKPQGRKKTHVARPAKNTNWLTPFCWTQIVLVAKQVGSGMSASAIAKGLRVRDPITFAKISRTTIDAWIDRPPGLKPRWKDKVLCRVEDGNSPGHNKGGRRGVLAPYPEVVEAIKTSLVFLRDKSVPVSLITARAIIVATILWMKPEIFSYKFKDGSSFRVSESFTCTFLHGVMLWSMRKATQAAQKLPKDWEHQCTQAFFRRVYTIKEYDIPIYLVINFDQTQMIYVPGNRMTWSQTGAKQVGMVGMDEKRAFTLVVGVTANGTVLPFQAVFVGKTKASVPSSDSANYADTMNAGFQFAYSGTATYWSNQKTMREYMDKIIAPYCERLKHEHGLPPTQKSLVQLDVWSVHRSEEFRNWMRANHPSIILDFVPGGCTGVHQLCDVGIQRPLKLLVKKSYHEDVVEDLLSQANQGTSTPNLKEGIKDLRDRSPRWMWNAYKALNNEKLVKKVGQSFLLKKNNT